MNPELIQVFFAIAGFAVACLTLIADFRRRRLPQPAIAIALAVFVPAVAGALLARSIAVRSGAGQFSPSPLGGLALAIVAAILIARAYRIPALIVLDAASPAAAAGLAIAAIGRFALPSMSASTHTVELLVWATIFWFLWGEGRAAMQWQRPNGIVIGEFLVLVSFAQVLFAILEMGPGAASRLTIAAAIPLLAGGVILAVALRGYYQTREEHRIVDHISSLGQQLQPEYTPATPECPFPQRWKMYDTMTAEVDVLEFLRCLVTTMKPNLIVETGSFVGISTLAFAEGLKKNGFGRIISCEFDPKVFAKAQARVQESGLGEWIDLRNQSSLDMPVEGTIDLLYSDSDEKIREDEVRRFLPQMNPNGLILMHDAGSHYKIVREAAIRLQNEGLISVVFLPTPRGLVIAQPKIGKGSGALHNSLASQPGSR